MIDGRTRLGARSRFASTSTIFATAGAVLGLGVLTASPAAAEPDLDTAQARVERLSERADAVAARRDDAAGSLKQARKRQQGLHADIVRQRRLFESLESQLARIAGDGYSGAAGNSVVPAALPEAAELMLANVAVVSEDTEGRAEAMVVAGEKLERLVPRARAARERVRTLSGHEQALGSREEQAMAKVAQASSVVAAIEEKAAEAQGGSVVDFAMAQVGKSYVYGAAGPDSFDCSGLTMRAWQQKGVSLPHNSTAQYSSGQRISESELQPGDLVFYYSPISHVGLYVGGGKVVNALNPGSGVRVSGLHDMPYVGAVRPG